MTSSDFVPLEKRQQGLTIRAYKIAPDGTRHSDTGPVTLDPDDVSAHATHPAATWPVCGCHTLGGDRDRTHSP